ncbi:FAD-dependent oxidoreductase [Candidatus Giovannonibacteria bacterium]|nr:FAD-dependent oxidoreductase [Candidatus Giovannonibacteria bacterium]
MYDLIIIGGGPAGVAAGVYAERKKIKTLLITDSFGGQSLVSADVRNWIGTKSVSGYDLGKMLEDHLRDHADIDIVADDVVEKIEKLENGFRVTAKSGKSFETKYILIATGSRRRKLGIPGEKEFDGKGVVYCSTCDAPVFKDKVTAVIGGGNAGLEAVMDLFPYASKIYLIVRSDSLKGDPVTQDKVKNSAKVQVIYNALTQEVLGDQLVTGLAYKDAKSGDVKELKVDGVFVEIGLLPNSEVMNGLVELNGAGEIVVDHKTQQTSDPGIWAVGDVSDVLYKQNNVSAGDAVKAVLNIYDRLRKS